jgi:hypothetical protein
MDGNAGQMPDRECGAEGRACCDDDRCRPGFECVPNADADAGDASAAICRREHAAPDAGPKGPPHMPPKPGADGGRPPPPLMPPGDRDGGAPRPPHMPPGDRDGGPPAPPPMMPVVNADAGPPAPPTDPMGN